MEPQWHDCLSRRALVELCEGLLMAMDKSVSRLDAIAHHLSLLTQQGEAYEVLGGISDQVADVGDELYSASDRDRLKEWGHQIDTPDNKAFIAKAKEATQSEDVDRIKAAAQALAQASLKIGEAVYGGQQAAGQPGSDAGQGKSAGNENVVDADFEEVKEDKKKSG